MSAFRIYLAIVVVALATYTAIVGFHHGWNLLPIFLSDIAEATWRGQFNCDFTTFLSLSGLWLAWRNHFSPGGIALGIAGFFGGMIVLAPYLLWTTSRAGGDMKVVLLGEARAHGR